MQAKNRTSLQKNNNNENKIKSWVFLQYFFLSEDTTARKYLYLKKTCTKELFTKATDFHHTMFSHYFYTFKTQTCATSFTVEFLSERRQVCLYALYKAALRKESRFLMCV